VGRVCGERYDEEDQGVGLLAHPRHEEAAAAVQLEPHVLPAHHQVLGDPALVADDELSLFALELARARVQVAPQERAFLAVHGDAQHVVLRQLERNPPRVLPLAVIAEDLAGERPRRQAVARLAAIGVDPLEAPAMRHRRRQQRVPLRRVLRNPHRAPREQSKNRDRPRFPHRR